MTAATALGSAGTTDLNRLERHVRRLDGEVSESAAPPVPFPTSAGSLVLPPTLFVALVWVTLLPVLAVFAFVLYGVLRAGGVDLSSGGER